MNGDGTPEVLVVGAERGGQAAFMGEDDKGRWRAGSTLPFDIAGCASVRSSLIAGRIRAVAPLASVLEIDGRPIRMQPAPWARGKAVWLEPPHDYAWAA